MTTSPQPQETAIYEISLRGKLDAAWASRLEVMSLTHGPDGTTTLRTHPADQPALHGLFQRVRDLGLTLIAATRIDPEFDR